MIPKKPYTEIIKDLLYMGGLTAHFYLKQDNVEYNDWIVCAIELEPDWGYVDNIDWIKINDCEIDQHIINKVEVASDLAVDCIREKMPILITCAAGLNRSGLVTALTLMKLGYKDPIEILRRKRSPYVLCNGTFEKYVLERLEE